LFEVVSLILHVFFFGFVLLLHDAIILSIMLLCIATTPCYYRFTLLLAPPYYCTLLSLHLATIMSSTLLLLQAPPCHCYSTIIAVMPGFLPYCVVAQPCCFSTFAISLLVSSTNGLT
jgi:hypothetical protein